MRFNIIKNKTISIALIFKLLIISPLSAYALRVPSAFQKNNEEANQRFTFRDKISAPANQKLWPALEETLIKIKEIISLNPDGSVIKVKFPASIYAITPAVAVMDGIPRASVYIEDEQIDEVKFGGEECIIAYGDNDTSRLINSSSFTTGGAVPCIAAYFYSADSGHDKKKMLIGFHLPLLPVGDKADISIDVYNQIFNFVRVLMEAYNVPTKAVSAGIYGNAQITERHKKIIKNNLRGILPNLFLYDGHWGKPADMVTAMVTDEGRLCLINKIDYFDEPNVFIFDEGDIRTGNDVNLETLAYRATGHSITNISSSTYGFGALFLELAKIYDREIHGRLEKEYDSWREAYDRLMGLLSSDNKIDLRKELEFFRKKTETLTDFFKLNFERMSQIRDFASDDEAEMHDNIRHLDTSKELLNNFVELLFSCMSSNDIVKIADFYVKRLRQDACKFSSKEKDLYFNQIADREGLIVIGLIDNFFANSRDADSPIPYLAIKALREDGYVRLEFSDRGRGILPEVLERIFDKKFTTKQHGKGGLGLGLTLEYIRAKGGQIQVDTKVEGEKARRLVFLDDDLSRKRIMDSDKTETGTTFTVWLPVLRPESSLEDKMHGLRNVNSATMLLRVPIDEGQKRLGKARSEITEKREFTVLLVENNPDEAGEYREALEKKGYSVVVAKNGSGAEKYLLDPDNKLPSLILLDYDMKPKGAILARNLKSMNINVPITGHTKNHEIMWRLCKGSDGEALFQWMNKFNSEYLGRVEDLYRKSESGESGKVSFVNIPSRHTDMIRKILKKDGFLSDDKDIFGRLIEGLSEEKGNLLVVYGQGDRKLKGYALYEERKKSFAYITRLYIVSEERGKGYAGRVLEEFQKRFGRVEFE